MPYNFIRDNSHGTNPDVHRFITEIILSYGGRTEEQASFVAMKYWVKVICLPRIVEDNMKNTLSVTLVQWRQRAIQRNGLTPALQAQERYINPLARVWAENRHRYSGRQQRIDRENYRLAQEVIRDVFGKSAEETLKQFQKDSQSEN